MTRVYSLQYMAQCKLYNKTAHKVYINVEYFSSNGTSYQAFSPQHLSHAVPMQGKVW